MLMERGMSLLGLVGGTAKFWTFCFVYDESLAPGICASV
jgi:hypothetical protein